MRYFLISLIFLISSNLYSQIGQSKKVDKIIDVGSVERILGDYISVYSLSYLKKEGNTFYALAFTNEQTLYDDNSPDQKVLVFRATQAEFDYLFKFLLEGFEEDQIRYLEVGEDVIKTLPLINNFLYIHVDYKDGSSASLKLKKRQLSKLFGKKLAKKRRKKNRK